MTLLQRMTQKEIGLILHFLQDKMDISMKTSVTPITKIKDKFKLRNWKENNSNLSKRGSLTLWIDASVLEDWSKIDPTKKEVGQRIYLDSIILCCLLLKINFRLKYRQSTGFISSLLLLMGKGKYVVVDYTTLCRRQSLLLVEVSQRLEQGEKLDIAIDSTGLKVCGEGEWKVRRHGVFKRRTWCKLHIGIDVDSRQIIWISLTGNDTDDAAEAVNMLEGRAVRINSFRGDGAYNDFYFRKALGNGIVQIILPPKDAVTQKGARKKPAENYLGQRNQAIGYINEHGREAWKIQTGYHRRNLNEVVMFRYKTTFGGELNARKIENQSSEVKIKYLILNKYALLGLPDSYKVA